MSRPHPANAVRRSASAPLGAERVAWVVLAVLACVVAHELTYQLVYRAPGEYRSAMSVLGHDGYWAGLVAAVAAATAILLAVAARQLRRLRREAGTTPALAADEAPGLRAYLGLVAATWLRLGALAVLVFTAQENLEAMVAGLPFRGLDVILGHGLVPIVLVVAATLLMSLAVALVRWRRRVLLGRLAAAPRTWSRGAGRRRPSAILVRPARHAAGAWSSRAPPAIAASPAL